MLFLNAKFGLVNGNKLLKIKKWVKNNHCNYFNSSHGFSNWELICEKSES